MRLGADTDGRLLAAEARVVADTGAYASYGPAVINRSAACAFGPYDIPEVTVDAYGVFTNNPIAGAMRGFGIPQMVTASEQLMDMLAERAGVTPEHIRRLNGFVPGRALTPAGQQIADGLGLMATLDAVTSAGAVGTPGGPADGEVLP